MLKYLGLPIDFVIAWYKRVYDYCLGTATQHEQCRQITGLGVPLENLSGPGPSMGMQSARRIVQQPTTRSTIQQPTLQQSSLSSFLVTSQPSSNLPLSSGTSQRQANLLSLFKLESV